MTGNFDSLTPEEVIASAEQALQLPFSGVFAPLPSYVNRVYELQTQTRQSLIFKFYRPGRWSRAALLEEHLFTLQCHEAEIPVIPPLRLAGGSTLGRTASGIFFCAFPKRWGRQFEFENDDEAYRRMGRLLARLHQVGASAPARHRVRLDPRAETLDAAARLLSCGAVSGKVFPEVKRVLSLTLRELAKRWHPSEVIRLHGDCHKGNILERPGEGLMLIDFDDMQSGPPVQDLWLLLPGRVPECRRELDLLLEGYESLRKFNRQDLTLIEPLRSMRMIYYLDWCARQRNDANFAERNPGWGSDRFWREESAALEEQLIFMLGL